MLLVDVFIAQKYQPPANLNLRNSPHMSARKSCHVVVLLVAKAHSKFKKNLIETGFTYCRC